MVCRHAGRPGPIEALQRLSKEAKWDRDGVPAGCMRVARHDMVGKGPG